MHTFTNEQLKQILHLLNMLPEAKNLVAELEKLVIEQTEAKAKKEKAK